MNRPTPSPSEEGLGVGSGERIAAVGVTWNLSPRRSADGPRPQRVASERLVRETEIILTSERAAGEGPPALRDSRHAPRTTHHAFSLIEVMVALGIFFMAVFAILGLMSTLLQNARIFQKVKPPEARMVFAYQTSITNRVIEGTISFEFSEMADFGDEFRDYSAEVEAYPNEMYTNGLWDVQYRVLSRRTGRVESTFTTHQFDPNTKSKSLSGGGLR